MKTTNPPTITVTELARALNSPIDEMRQILGWQPILGFWPGQGEGAPGHWEPDLPISLGQAQRIAEWLLICRRYEENHPALIALRAGRLP